MEGSFLDVLRIWTIPIECPFSDYTHVMRFVLMMASILVVSYLIFKGYSTGLNNSEVQVGGEKIDALKKAGEVNQLIQDAAEVQRQEIEKQLQQ